MVLQRVRFVPLAGHARGFPSVRAARAASRERGRRQHGMGRRLQGFTDAVRRTGAPRPGAGVRRRRGSPDPPGSSASPTAGSSFTPTNGLTIPYARAENGNVAVTGEIDLVACDGTFVMALGFGPTAMEAGQHALITPARRFRRNPRRVRPRVASMARAARGRRSAGRSERAFIDISAAVLRTHESKRVEGGIIASLSIPWGFSKPDDDLGGYHLVWPRDLVEIAGGFIAIGAPRARQARAAVPAGDAGAGRPLVAEHVARRHARTGTACRWTKRHCRFCWSILLRAKASSTPAGRDALWPMVRRAAVFLARNGPVSPQDRWEEQPGYAPFTVATEIAALLVAADLADAASNTIAADVSARDRRRLERQHRAMAVRVRGPNSRNSTASKGITSASRRPITAMRRRRRQGFVPIKNRPPDQAAGPAALMVSLDALAFVRFGLRAPDDPRILSTVKVIDATLKVETPRGPAWRRYQGDGYGEHADGSAVSTERGVGRAWPLLTGERAHYELAAGRSHVAEHLAQAMETIAGEAGLLPEQIWDSADIPERELFLGHPSGSAMPLVWAHAEYLKLCRSLFDGHVFDRPPQTVERYLVRANDVGPHRLALQQ